MTREIQSKSPDRAMLTSKDKKYLEMLIANDALIDSDIIPLDDGMHTRPTIAADQLR